MLALGPRVADGGREASPHATGPCLASLRAFALLGFCWQGGGSPPLPRNTAALYEGPPQPNQREWPAGALLPDTGVVRSWAWRTLQAAKEELQLAVESVMEDLEGLGATSCNSSGGQNLPMSV